MAFTGTIKNLTVRTQNAATAGQSFTFTINSGAEGAIGASSVTCQIAGASAKACSDTTHTLAITANQLWNLQITTSSGSAATGSWSVAFEYDTP
jgi:hypothetical protein